MNNRSDNKKGLLRRPLLVLLCLALCFAGLNGCGAKKETAELKDCGLQHEDEFGGAYILCTIDDFNAKGFTYGDSVNISFSNGYTMDDLPYYNGYYTITGDPLLIAYPGYPYIKAAINNGDDLWKVAGLKDGDKATVTLKEKGKYLAVQEARDIHYKDDRNEFDSDEKFANFRAVKVSGVAENKLYRSASPCDNQHKRAPYVDKLMEKAGVQFILDLADTPQKIEGYISASDFNSPYFLSLYRNGMVGTPLKDLLTALEAGQVEPIALNMNYNSQEFKQKVANGLSMMAEADGPYLVHCTEGKDRTGFVCMLLEALCGASRQEITEDYMITYDNYYGISTTEQKDKYDVIVESVLGPMLQCIDNGKGKDATAQDLKTGAEKYLMEGGMSLEKIVRLRSKLTAKQ